MKAEDQLREELREFQKEKERIKDIVGQIGGTPSREHKIVNVLLIAIIAGLLILGGVFSIISPALAVQVAILFSVIKLIWMFYESRRATHFQFWVLNSIEFRMNEVYKRVKKIDKELNELRVCREYQNEEKNN